MRKRFPKPWYYNKVERELVKENPSIKDLYSEVNMNMKSTDLMDFDKLLGFMMSCENCKDATINLSNCRIKITILMREKNILNSMCRIEIIDKYICNGYVNKEMKLKDIFRIVREALKYIAE